MSEALRIATRGSMQARRQADVAAAALSERAGVDVEFVIVQTTGDQRQDVPLHQIGGQGVFVKEVQRAVLDGRADLAAHSAKDLPSTAADGLVIGAFCERRSPWDVLVGCAFDELPPGATIASGSVRRRAQMSALRPDLRFVELRGNIQTRLEKIPDGGAIVMAEAALQILGLEHRIASRFTLEQMVPQAGQGCVALECRADDERTRAVLALLDHLPTRRCVEAERAFLATLGSGCSLPVGAYAHLPTNDSHEVVLHTFVGT
ncbi:MAG: porphobilinogen deaminase [Actinomycetota bacterium]|jgi:hydroxymethylbilane synthase